MRTTDMARNKVKKRRGTEPGLFQRKVTQQKYFREETRIQAQDSVHELYIEEALQPPPDVPPFALCLLPFGPVCLHADMHSSQAPLGR